MTQIAEVYAQSLYALANEENLTRDILQQLDVLADAFRQNPAFSRLLSTPNLSKEERRNILDDSFRGKVHPYVLNFLKILMEKGYLRHFPDCCKAYTGQYNADRGILPVQAVTAIALTPAQTERLTQKLSALTGKAVELTNRVDPDCLGGVRLDYDGVRLDGTVKNRLEGIARQLKNTVL